MYGVIMGLLGFRVQGLCGLYWAWGYECRGWDLGLGFRALGLGLGFWVWDSGFKVQG